MMAQRPPLTALVQGSDGKFYGTTSGGFGTVFQITTDRALTILYAFQGGNDGAGPSGLAQGSDGDFYGTTSAGGTNNVGTVFQTSTNGGLTSLHSFTGIDGEQPSAALLRSSDGDFYGTTSGGGAHANQFGQGGTVFQISTNAVFTSLYSFTGGDDGYGPNGLAQGSDGSFYGTTSSGGSNSVGTVFQIRTNGEFTSLYSFTGRDDGYGPNGLAQGSDGSFYGTTFSGGSNSVGTVFEINTNGQLTTLYAFGTVTNASGGALDGANPQAALVQGSDGNFYGTTAYDGVGYAGTVFRLAMVPEFQPLTLTNGRLSLSWSTEAGGVYQLQYNSDLSSGNWVNLGSAATASGTTLSTTDSITNGPQRFYRLLLAP
jgi:uncharacterized repeat protein (TIGR03803 family)